MQQPQAGPQPERDPAADPDGSEGPDESVDALVARLEARVAQRRAAGEYPPDLDHALDAQWQALVPPPDALALERLDELAAAVAAARASADGPRRGFDPGTVVDALERMQVIVRALRDEVLRDRTDRG